MGARFRALNLQPMRHVHARQCIEAVLARVDSMVALVQSLDYSPLERANAGRWASVRAQFNLTNEEVKVATRDLINTCFRCSTSSKCLQVESMLKGDRKQVAAPCLTWRESHLGHIELRFNF